MRPAAGIGAVGAAGKRVHASVRGLCDLDGSAGADLQFGADCRGARYPAVAAAASLCGRCAGAGGHVGHGASGAG
jgi:hypothetical protein